MTTEAEIKAILQQVDFSDDDMLRNRRALQQLKIASEKILGLFESGAESVQQRIDMMAPSPTRSRYDEMSARAWMGVD